MGVVRRWWVVGGCAEVGEGVGLGGGRGTTLIKQHHGSSCSGASHMIGHGFRYQHPWHRQFLTPPYPKWPPGMPRQRRPTQLAAATSHKEQAEDDVVLTPGSAREEEEAEQAKSELGVLYNKTFNTHLIRTLRMNKMKYQEGSGRWMLAECQIQALEQEDADEVEREEIRAREAEGINANQRRKVAYWALATAESQSIEAEEEEVLYQSLTS